MSILNRPPIDLPDAEVLDELADRKRKQEHDAQVAERWARIQDADNAGRKREQEHRDRQSTIDDLVAAGRERPAGIKRPVPGVDLELQSSAASTFDPNAQGTPENYSEMPGRYKPLAVENRNVVDDDPLAGQRQAAIVATEGSSTAAEAEIDTLSKAYGMPPGVIRAFTPERRKQLLLDLDIKESTETAPTLREMYAVPEFMAAGKEDVKLLAQIENTLRGIGDAVKGTLKVPDAVGYAAKRVEFQYAIRDLLAPTFAKGYQLDADQERQLGELNLRMQINEMMAQGLAPGAEGVVPYVADAVTDFATQQALGFPKVLQRGTQGLVVGTGVGAAYGAAGGTATVPGLGTIAGAGSGAAVGGAAGFAVGAQTGMLENAASLEAALAFVEFRDMTDSVGGKLDPEIAYGAATVVGALNAGLELTGARSVLKAVPGGDMLLGKGTKDVVKLMLRNPNAADVLRTIARKGLVAAITEGGTEFVQEFVNIAAGEAAKAVDPDEFETIDPLDALMRMRDAGFKGAVGGHGVATIGATVQEVVPILQDAETRSMRDLSRSGTSLERLRALATFAEQSKLREANAQKFEAFVARVAQDTPFDSLYFEATTFAQVAADAEIDVKELAARLGVEDQLDSAQAGNADLQVPLAAFLARMGGDELMEPLLAHAKTSVFGFSQEQLKTAPAEERAKLEGEADRLLQASAKQKDLATDIALVRQNIEEQLQKVGRFAGEVNTAYARIMSNAYGVLAERMGLNVADVYERYPINIGGESITGNVIPQSSEIEVVHYSPVADLTEADPAKWGSNRRMRLPPEETQSMQTAPKRVYFGGASYRKEENTGDNKYFAYLDANRLYDADADPLGLRGKTGPIVEAGKNRRVTSAVTGEEMLAPLRVSEAAAFEQLIREAGFAGYRSRNPRVGDVVVSFEKVQLTKEQRKEPGLAVAKQAAEAYMQRAGLPYAPPKGKVEVDVERAKRIAAAYEEMQHAPNDPEVRAAYEAMAAETLAQWQVIKETGLVVEFMPEDGDPYASPHAALRDIEQNNHLYVFSTDVGYGQEAITAEQIAENPLLALSGETFGGKPARVNDVFRAVHDYFGHVKDGHGFRAKGEENAWRSHQAMYSPLAARAMTSETRGQNSWVNYGPHGESNRTAKTEDTVFAEQKIGLMPEWVSQEVSEPATLAQNARGRRTEQWTQIVSDYLATQDNAGSLSLSEIVRATGAPIRVADKARTAARKGTSPAAEGYTQEDQNYLRALYGNSLDSVVRNYQKAVPGADKQTPAQIAAALNVPQFLVDDVFGQQTATPGRRRGEYQPATMKLALLRNADMSTFLHEMGHHFLHVYTTVAAGLQQQEADGLKLTDTQRELVRDMNLLLEKLDVRPGAPTASDNNTVLPQDILYAVRFYEAYKEQVTEAELKALFIAEAQQGRVPDIRLFKHPGGRISGWLNPEPDLVSHADARTLLNMPDPKVLHGRYVFGLPLSSTSWYQGSDTLGQEDIKSYRAYGKLTAEQRRAWFNDNVIVRPEFGGLTYLWIRSDQSGETDVAVKISHDVVGERGATVDGIRVDMAFNGRTSRDTTKEGKSTPQSARDGHRAFLKTLAAIETWLEDKQPAFVRFSPSGESQQKLYDFVLRNFNIGGYEARVIVNTAVNTDTMGVPSDPADDTTHNYLLVHPSRVKDVQSIQDRIDVYGGYKLYRDTEIVERSGSGVLAQDADEGGSGTRRAVPGRSSREFYRFPERTISDAELTRASRDLPEMTFEVWKLAPGRTVDEIAILLDPEGDMTVDVVRSHIRRARLAGYDIPRMPTGLDPKTLRVLYLSAQGMKPADIYKAGVYRGDGRPKEKVLAQIRVLRTQHKDTIAQIAGEQTTFGQEEASSVWHYSALLRAVEESKTTKASAAQWKATLQRTPGVKAEELEWTGVSDWLDMQEGSIERSALVAYLGKNGVRVGEVTKNADLELLLREYEKDLIENGHSDPPYFVKHFVLDADDAEDGEGGERFGVYSHYEGREPVEVFEDEDKAYEWADEANGEHESEQVSEAVAERRREFERGDFSNAYDLDETGVPKFGSYSLQGGENYTELLLTLPMLDGPGTHWDEESVVAHVRFKVREVRSEAPRDADEIKALRAVYADVEERHMASQRAGQGGLFEELQAAEAAIQKAINARRDLSVRKILAIEEIQSDWHQEGREEGYSREASAEEKQAAEKAEQDAHLAVVETHKARMTLLAGILDATPGGAELLASSAYNKHMLGEVNPSWTREVERLKAEGAASSSHLQFMLQGVLNAMNAKARMGDFQHDVIANNSPETLQQLRSAEQAHTAASLRLTEASIALRNTEGAGTPDAPFKNNAWVTLALKRMIRYAAENGFDNVSWVPGNVKNGNVYAPKVATHLSFNPYQTAQVADDGTTSAGAFSFRDKSLNPVGTTLTQAELERYGLGGGVAESIIKAAQEQRGLQYIDGAMLPAPITIQTVEGWEFYDRIVVNEANKLGKKYGAKVERTNVIAGRQGLDFHTLPITPELKAAALAGLPLFQNGETPPAQGPLPEGATPLEIWNNMSLAQQTEYHERFARLTEAYFYEGKAPTPALRPLFETLRRWMLGVYKNLEELNVEMTPEVRSVMDRMYASADALATAQREYRLAPLFAVKPEFMSTQEWEEYQGLNENALNEAQAALTQRSLRDLKWLSNARSRELKRLQAEAKEQRRAVKAEVADEVLAEPVNVARRVLMKGIDDNGEPIPDAPKLSIEALKEMYPEATTEDWRRLGYGKNGMLASNGLHPDELAPLFGYTSGDALLRDLLMAENASEKIAAETDRRMLERYGDLTSEEDMAKAADRAVHEGLRGKVLAAEYAALSNAQGERKLINDAAKESARNIVLRMPMMKLTPHRHLAAERKAGRAAEEALRKNDLAGAAAAKREQLLSYHMSREIFERIKQRDSAMGNFRRILLARRDVVAKYRNFDLVQAARAVLVAYGFGQMRNAPVTYLDAVKTYDPALYSALEPQIINAFADDKKLKDLNVEQFLGLRDTVKQLWTLSREEKQMQVGNEKLELDDVVDQLNQRLEDIGTVPAVVTRNPTKGERALRQIEGLFAGMRRVETWARAIDGGTGVFTKYIWRPISQAADAYRVDKSRYLVEFRRLFDTIEKTLTKARIAAPELGAQGFTFANKSELLHAILHTGNKSNLRKLLLGRSWATEGPDGVMDTRAWDRFLARMVAEGVLTAADYQFAQSVWNLMEKTKPAAQKAHRAVFGRYFDEIAADKLTTPFGEFPGGYVPAIYDDYHTQDAALRAEQNAIEANDSSMFPAPASGFTKGRVDYNKELALDLRLLPAHIDQVLKFSHLASPVRNALRLTRNRSFERMLSSYHPTALTDLILPWLNRAAQQTTNTPTKGQGGKQVDKFWNSVRNRGGMGLMFANIVNTLQQATGFSLAVLRMPKRYLAKGLFNYLRDPGGVAEAIRDMSPLMVTRGDTQASAMNSEMQHIALADGPYEKTQAWFQRHVYFMQTAVQNVMDNIVWLGAFEAEKAKGVDEVEAAARADGVVRTTQGSAVPEDMSRVEAGSPFWRIFVHMYGYFNMQANLVSTEWRIAARDMGLLKGAGRMVYVYTAGFMIPMVVGELIAGALRGQLPDEDDEGLDGWLAWFFGTQLRGGLATVPVAGQVAGATFNAFNDKPYDDRVLASPAVSILESVTRTPVNIYKLAKGDGDLSRTAKDALTLITVATGIPVQALARPIAYALDVEEGDTSPEDDLDYVRGLVSGSAGQ